MFYMRFCKFVITCALVLSFMVCVIVSNKVKKKVSELIREAVEYSEFLDKTDSKVKEVIADGLEKFETITKLKIRPAWDKFEGIKNQTELYEAMDIFEIAQDEESRTFTTFSMAELMIIQVDFFVTQREYSEINRQLTEDWDILIEQITECRSKLKYFVEDEFQKPLSELQIYFEPVDLDDLSRQNKPRPAKNMSTSDIMKIVTSQLIPLVESMEEIKVEDGLPPHFEITDVTNIKLFQFLQGLMDHLEVYDLQYQTLLWQWMEKLANMDTTIDIQLYKNLDGTKWRLEEMAMGIERELPLLVERIKKLRDKMPPSFLNQEATEESHDEL